MMWMFGIAAACLASWLGVVAMAPAFGTAAFFGMIGPLVAVVGTWGLAERTARVNPAGVAADRHRLRRRQ